MNTLTISNPDITNLLVRVAWLSFLVSVLLGVFYFSTEPRKHSILIIAIILILICALCITICKYYVQLQK